jgi:hypothetical protein
MIGPDLLLGFKPFWPHAQVKKREPCSFAAWIVAQAFEPAVSPTFLSASRWKRQRVRF